MTDPGATARVGHSGDVPESSGSRVSRRAVLRGVGAGVATVAVAGSGVLSFRAYDQHVMDPAGGTAFEAWRAWRHRPGPLGVVAAAVLAANPHNTQPWLFRLAGSRIDLHVDAARNTGTVDPLRREMFVGLGCALENLTVAARALGLSPTVRLLPGDDPTLVARVDLALTVAQPSTLYGAIGHRRTNRGPYRADPVSPGVLAELGAVAPDLPGISLVWISDRPRMTALGSLLVAAAEAVTQDDQQSRDDFAWFRHSADAITARKDGLAVEAQAMSPLMTTLGLLVPVSRPSSDRYWVENTRNIQTRTAAAYGIITVSDPHDRALRLLGGRHLQRLHLAATARGVALQHMNQLTERIDRDATLGQPSTFSAPMADLLAAPGRQPLVTFRVGYPIRTPHPSPRRRAEEVTR